MSERFSSSEIDRPALHGFMERVTRSLGHDLRSPLGTIVNYALLVEQDAAPEADTLRLAAQRIRNQAMHTAEMLQLLLDALLLASRPAVCTRVDAWELLTALVAEFDGGATLEVGAQDGAREPEIELDSAVVGFAWRAFLEIEKEISPARRRGAHVMQEPGGGEMLRLGLRLGSAFDESQGAVEYDAWIGGKPPIAAPRRFALSLSRDLVAAHGGELQLLGRAGADSKLMLCLPHAIRSRTAGKM